MSQVSIRSIPATLVCACLLLGLASRHVRGEDPGGPIGFSEKLLAGKLGYVFGVAAADLDGDGDLDLTSPDIRNKSHSTLFWYQNDGRGAFQRHVLHENEPGWFERHAIGDLNGDGKPDVAIINNLKGQVVWLANPGGAATGRWKRHVVTTNCPRAYGVALADLDGDGDLDAATAGYLSHLVAWYENPGKAGLGGEWKRRVIDKAMIEARTIEIADFNRDGKADLLATGLGKLSANAPDASDHGSQVVWFENPGQPAKATWIKHVIEDRLPAAVHGQPIDLDKDGDTDVVMAHGMRVETDPKVHRHQVVWYENIAGTKEAIPTWKRHAIGPLPFAFEAHAGDIDGDGDVDVAASAWSKGDRIVWFENRDGKWTRHDVRSNWPAANQLILADLDGDQRLDIVASADDGSRRVQGALELRWWRNEGRVKKK